MHVLTAAGDEEDGGEGGEDREVLSSPTSPKEGDMGHPSLRFYRRSTTAGPSTPLRSAQDDSRFCCVEGLH